MLLAVFVLVGCGPEEGASDADLTSETIRIAQEYQQSGELGNARTQLDKLDAANPTQLLILLAEERVSSDPGTPETNALVHFALALGLQSGKLMAYAIQNGLLANADAPTPAPITLPTVLSIAPVSDIKQTSDSDIAPPTAAVVAEIVTSTIAAAVPISSTSASSQDSSQELRG